MNVYFDFAADLLLIAGTFGLAVYCVVLSRRLSRLTSLEGGVGGAVAVLSAQVDDMTRTLEKAQTSASVSGKELMDLTARAEKMVNRLELHLASLHDIPDQHPSAVEKRTEPCDAVFVRHKEIAQ